MKSWRDETGLEARMRARHIAACSGELEPYEYAMMWHPCVPAEVWRRRGHGEHHKGQYMRWVAQVKERHLSLGEYRLPIVS